MGFIIKDFEFLRYKWYWPGTCIWEYEHGKCLILSALTQNKAASLHQKQIDQSHLYISTCAVVKVAVTCNHLLSEVSYLERLQRVVVHSVWTSGFNDARNVMRDDKVKPYFSYQSVVWLDHLDGWYFNIADLIGVSLIIMALVMIINVHYNNYDNLNRHRLDHDEKHGVII